MCFMDHILSVAEIDRKRITINKTVRLSNA